MNRTLLLFGAAGALALMALFVSPRLAPRPAPTPVSATTGSGSLQLTARFSHPLLPTGASEAFLTLDVKGVDVPAGERRPVQLALVIDRSGSMQGEKLQNAKAAARQLISQLTGQDSLALIHYGSDVEVLPSRPMTPGNKEAVLAAVDRIEDAGGTNLGDALAEAGKALAGGKEGSLRRIILVSDGQPTEGETDSRVLSNQSRSLRQQGLSVSAIGVGADFNEDLMQAIAELGAGSYGYLKDSAQLATLFSKDLQQASTLVARNAELRVDLPEGVLLKEALGYRSTQEGRRVRIPLSDIAARQLERVVLSLSVQASAAGTRMPVASVDLAYDDVLQKGPRMAQASLNAEVTEQLAAVEKSQDKEVAVNAARAQSAANVVRASEALRAGHKDDAKAILSQNKPLLLRAAGVAGAAAVAQDVAAQKELYDDFDNARGNEETEHQVKNAKRKALQDFGKLGSTY